MLSIETSVRVSLLIRESNDTMTDIPDIPSNTEQEDTTVIQEPDDHKTGFMTGVEEDKGEDILPLTGLQLRSGIEALLLIVDLPVTEVELAQSLNAAPQEVHDILITWQQQLEESGSGMQLRTVDGGWRLYTHPKYWQYVERFVSKGARTKLSRAALETLAVVAYRQPVSRQEVAAVRGVSVDAIMRTLQARGLIAPTADHDGSQGPQTYCTTPLFLEKLGVQDINQLPPLADFLPQRQSLDDLEQSLGD